MLTCLLRSLYIQSLASGFHIIATIDTVTTIVEVELKFVAAIVVVTIATIATIAPIAEELFPYNRHHRVTFFLNDRNDHKLWKPAFTKP